MRSTKPARASVVIAVLASILGHSCAAVGPDYSKPEVPMPSEWAGRLQGGLTNADLDPSSLARWWEVLDDPILDSLIDDAIAANLDLRTADSRLRQARAEREIAGGAFFPTLGAGASAGRTGGVGGGSAPTRGRYSGNFDASWEIDVFGGQRRALEAATADEQAAAEARRDVLVTVVAEVALNYVELRTFQRRDAIARKNLAGQEESLRIVRAQYNRGGVSRLDVDQAESNAASTRAQIPTLSQNITRAKNRLSTLLAKPPGSLDDRLAPPRDLPVPPLEVAVGVPADVLRRRPDVRQAERVLAAQTARVGVSTAELYPKFYLDGSIGVDSLSMFGPTGQYSLGPRLQWPIYDGRRNRLRIDVQNEIQEQALIAYEAALLNALEETENSLTAFAEEQVRLQSLRRSAQTAESAASLASKRYKAGAIAFLDVLVTERTQLAAEDSEAASEAQVVSNLIRLYKALGGGWTSLADQGAGPAAEAGARVAAP